MSVTDVMEKAMPRTMPRRAFIRSGLRTGAVIAGLSMRNPWSRIFAAPRRDMTFRPFPHPWMSEFTYAYAADENENPFASNIHVNREGVVVPEDFGFRKFSVNARWFVDGFGYLWLSADNAGEYYTQEAVTKSRCFNLNYEFARSRVHRNRRVKRRYEREGVQFSSEVIHLLALSKELFEDSGKVRDELKRARRADGALKYALWAGEIMELEKAGFEIHQQQRKDKVFFGCETRQYVWAKSEEFTKRFAKLFNFATVTHYIWDTWYEVFEPEEGKYNWGIKDNIVNWLDRQGITVQGRPLFWFHPIVTPNWLKEKSFDDLKRYVENHTKNVVGHYGDRVLQWEVVNEYHDWANIHHHTPEQITEIVRLACDKTREVNPRVVRILNHCAPWSEYAAWGRYAREKRPADRPLRSTQQFVEDLLNAGVDFDVLGIQVYFPRRDLSDVVRMLERFERFGKPIYITEIGVTSGPTEKSIATGDLGLPREPYEWHRYWDEELQADWLEQVYTLYYSRPAVKAINWYDFADFRTFIMHGGLVREDCSPKRSFHRLKELLVKWNRLPKDL